MIWACPPKSASFFKSFFLFKFDPVNEFLKSAEADVYLVLIAAEAVEVEILGKIFKWPKVVLPGNVVQTLG